MAVRNYTILTASYTYYKCSNCFWDFQITIKSCRGLGQSYIADMLTGHHPFASRVPPFLSSLPEEIKLAKSATSFKSLLETQFINFLFMRRLAPLSLSLLLSFVYHFFKIFVCIFFLWWLLTVWVFLCFNSSFISFCFISGPFVWFSVWIHYCAFDCLSKHNVNSV